MAKTEIEIKTERRYFLDPENKRLLEMIVFKAGKKIIDKFPVKFTDYHLKSHHLT